MAETKTFDYDFVGGLGKKIQLAADDSLPQAQSLAAEGQQVMMGAGQAGGILVVIGFFFASEYLEKSWETKLEEAGELAKAAETFVQNFQRVEEEHSR